MNEYHFPLTNDDWKNVKKQFKEYQRNYTDGDFSMFTQNEKAKVYNIWLEEKLNNNKFTFALQPTKQLQIIDNYEIF